MADKMSKELKSQLFDLFGDFVKEPRESITDTNEDEFEEIEDFSDDSEDDDDEE